MSAKNRSPKKVRRGGEPEHPLAPISPTPSSSTVQVQDEHPPPTPPTATIAHEDDMTRQSSEVPYWIELKKWREQLELEELHHLSLHQLARDGDVDRLRLLLDQAPNLDIMRKRLELRDEFGNAPLHYAARYAHFPVLSLLVGRKADVNASGEDEMRPLHFLARYKKANARRRSIVYERQRTRSFGDLEGLLRSAVEPRPGSGGSERQKRKSVSTASDPAMTKLKESAESVDMDMVTFLVSNGADVNAADQYGMTALHHCAMRSNRELAELILGVAEAKVDPRDRQNMTPLHVAAGHNSQDIAQMLLTKGADIRACDDQYNTPLHLAAQDNSLDIVQLLLRIGREERGGLNTVHLMLSDQDYEYNTPLFLAVQNGNMEVAKYLLAQGANANTHRVRFDSPLHSAAQVGDAGLVELLLKAGAKVDARNAERETPLHRALAYDHWKVAELLLDEGAALEATDTDGFTPLLVAAREGHPNSLRRLLIRQPDITAADKTERTAFFLAAEYNHPGILEVLLQDSGVKVKGKDLLEKGDRYMNSPLHKAAEKGHLDVVKALLEVGCAINGKNEEEKTPLHLAAKAGRTKVVKELLRIDRSLGFSIYADEDEDSNTPLHLSSTQGNVNVCKELIEAGATIGARNSILWTPLDCAAANGWDDTISLLLDYNAPINPVDKTRTTPLHLAAREGHVSVLNLLLARGATIDLTDHLERNCLDLAVENNHKDCAQAIIRHPHWRLALSNCQWVNGYRTTPLRKLIRSLPDVAAEVFSRCTEDNGLRPEDDNYAIKLDYTFLDDTYCEFRPDLRYPSAEDSKALNGDSPKQRHSDPLLHSFDLNGELLPHAKPYTDKSEVLKQSHPLMLMVRWERTQLLSHPLARSLLRRKWNSHGRYVYYAFLLVYALHVACLTGFVVLTPPTFDYYDDLTPHNFSFGDACRAAKAAGTLPNQEPYMKSLQYAIIVLSVFHVIKEIFQIYQRGINYLTWDNAVEWSVYMGSLLLCLNFSQCSRSTGLRTPWQWQLAALTVFLAWFGLVLYIQKLPRFGIYVVMFMDVLRTFTSFFLVFLLFIVAFALTFFVLFRNQDEFSSVGYSMIKTSVMMIGEFDYGDMFFGDKSKVHYQSASYAMFTIFVIIMTIIIANLLVCL